MYHVGNVAAESLQRGKHLGVVHAARSDDTDRAHGPAVLDDRLEDQRGIVHDLDLTLRADQHVDAVVIGARDEIEEVVRCINEGKITSDVMPPEATIQCAELYDKILRG